jgi:hypothetical protein
METTEVEEMDDRESEKSRGIVGYGKEKTCYEQKP